MAGSIGVVRLSGEKKMISKYMYSISRIYFFTDFYGYVSFIRVRSPSSGKTISTNLSLSIRMIY